MEDAARLVSKVLILEHDPAAVERLRLFCDAHDLVGLRAQGDTVLAVLKSNVDLGGIFLAEDHEVAEAPGLALAHAIHALRPELPIFLRRRDAAPLPEESRRAVRAIYTTETIDELAPVIEESIFCLVYPNALVRGISEISVNALQALFRDRIVRCEAPYIVRDRIIYGEVFTLIPLESSWCRGYMMLQTEEDAMRAAIGLEHDDPEATFRELNKHARRGDQPDLGRVQEPLHQLQRRRGAPDADPDRDQPPPPLHLVRLAGSAAVLPLRVDRSGAAGGAARAGAPALHLQPRVVAGRLQGEQDLGGGIVQVGRARDVLKAAAQRNFGGASAVHAAACSRGLVR